MADNEFYRVDVVIDVQGEENTKRSLTRTQKVIDQTKKKTKLLDKVKASPVVRIVDRATRPLRALGKRITDFTRKHAAKMAALGLAAVSGFVIASNAEFIRFEKGMNEVFTLMPGITQSAMDDMSKDVRQFSKDFGVLPDKVVPALYQSISAGVPKDNVFDFLATAQKAAVGGVTELETAVDGISSVVNAYGTDVIDAQQASDLMFTAVKLGKTNFEQLSGSLYNVIPTASALGVEFGDVTAAMAAMTAQGTPTSVATTQMRQLLVELSKEGGKASDAFKKLSGKSFKDFVAEGNNVQDALQLMEQGAAETGVGINDLFGGVEAGNAALSLTGKGTEAFGNALEEMAGAAGATDAAYDQMEKGLGRSLEKIKANFKVLMLDVGEKMAPTVAKLAEAFQKRMPAIENAVKGAFDKVGQVIGFVKDSVLPPLIDAFNWVKDVGSKAFQKIQSVIEDNLPAFENIKGVASDVGAFLKGAFDLAKPVIEWVFTEGIPAVTDVILTLIEKATEFYNFIKDNWSTIEPFVLGIAAAFTAYKLAMIALKVPALILAGVTKAMTIAQWALNVAMSANPIGLIIVGIGILIGLGILLWKNWDKIKEKLIELWGTFTGWIADTWQSFTNWVNGIWGAVKEWFGNMKESFVDFFTVQIPGWIDDAIGFFNDLIAAGLDIGKEFIQGIIDGFLEMWESLKEKASEIWNSVTGIFSRKQTVNVDVASTGTAGGAAAYARGGILTRPHLGLVAEEGPEAIIPLASAKKQRAVRLWEETGKRLGVIAYAGGAVIAPPAASSAPRVAVAGGGGNSFNVDVDAQVDVSVNDIDEEAMALEIGMKIVREIKNALTNRG